MRNIANPAKQFPRTHAKSSNQPINFETISLSKEGRSEAARWVRAAMFSESDLTGEGDGVGACACTTTGSSRIATRMPNRNARLRFIAVSFVIAALSPKVFSAGVAYRPSPFRGQTFFLCYFVFSSVH